MNINTQIQPECAEIWQQAARTVEHEVNEDCEVPSGKKILVLVAVCIFRNACKYHCRKVSELYNKALPA